MMPGEEKRGTVNVAPLMRRHVRQEGNARLSGRYVDGTLFAQARFEQFQFAL